MAQKPQPILPKPHESLYRVTSKKFELTEKWTNYSFFPFDLIDDQSCFSGSRNCSVFCRLVSAYSGIGDRVFAFWSDFYSDRGMLYLCAFVRLPSIDDWVGCCLLAAVFDILAAESAPSDALCEADISLSWAVKVGPFLVASTSLLVYAWGKDVVGWSGVWKFGYLGKREPIGVTPLGVCSVLREAESCRMF